MVTKKAALSIIVILVAFSVGYVTFQIASFLNNWLVGAYIECRQKKELKNCSDSIEKPISAVLPAR